jgi:hypothetical protein
MTKTIPELRPELQLLNDTHLGSLIRIHTKLLELNKTKDMNIVNVLPVVEKQDYLYSNEVSREHCFFWDAQQVTTGVAILTAKGTTECFVKWSNGNNSCAYPNFNELVKAMTEQTIGHSITVHNIKK